MAVQESYYWWQTNRSAFLQMLCIFIGVNSLIGSALGLSTVKYCFFGTDINSQDALLNQTCETAETHIAQTMVATDHVKGDDVPDSAKAKTLSNYSILSSSDGANCFIFRRVTSGYLAGDWRIESVHIAFGCDYDSICVGKEADTIIDKIAIRGQLGQLYCCSSDNCNSIDKMPHTPAENRVCYTGSSNSSKVALESCGHPDAFCVKFTYFSRDSKYESYSCDKQDYQRQCEPSRINGAYRFCENSTTENGTIRELCCCDNNKCNRPSNPKLLPDEESTHRSSLDGNKREITNPIQNPQAQNKSNKVITGLVAAVVILVFAGIVIILYTAYKKGKQRKTMRQDPNVIMQYERLSASEPDLEDAVVV